MPSLSTPESIFLGTVLEGVFYGVYCVIFALFLKIERKSTGRSRLTYPLALLFVLCTAFMVLDFTQQFITIFRSTEPGGGNIVANINITTSMIYTFVDFIAQCVLIYRCWIMWDRKPLFIVVPSILALASFTTCLTLTIELIIVGRVKTPPTWFFPLGAASFSISALVNSVIAGLLILKLVLTHYQLKREDTLGQTHNLLPLIAILIESGTFTFVAQVIWTVLFGLQNTGFNSVNGLITMVYGITPTIIIVRVTMGTSFGEKTRHAASSLKFNDMKSYPATSVTAASMGNMSNKTFNEMSTGKVMDDYESVRPVSA